MSTGHFCREEWGAGLEIKNAVWTLVASRTCVENSKMTRRGGRTNINMQKRAFFSRKNLVEDAPSKLVSGTVLASKTRLTRGFHSVYLTSESRFDFPSYYSSCGDNERAISPISHEKQTAWFYKCPSVISVTGSFICRPVHTPEETTNALESMDVMHSHFSCAQRHQCR